MQSVDFISRLIWVFLQPSNFLFFSLFISGFFYIKQRGLFSKTILIISSLCLCLIALTPFPYIAAIPLENKYRAFHNKLLAKKYAGIITLAGSKNLSKSIYHNQVNFSKHGERLTETVKLARLLPHLKIIFSGGLHKKGKYEADIAFQFFTQMGLDKNRLILEKKSYNTCSNAFFTQKKIQALKMDSKKPWLLVTSAFHMPRAAACFKKLGVNIHPYPVDYYSMLGEEKMRLPNIGRSLADFDHIAHEWAGLMFYYLQGKIDEILPDIKASNNESS